MKRSTFFIIFLLGSSTLFSCARPFVYLKGETQALQKAEKYSLESDVLYKKAIQELKKALKESGDPKNIHFRLGQLYFERADYPLAIEHLIKINSELSRKLLAISYYQTGKYTDALNLFSQLGEINDDEYLYYYGLTCERHNLYDQAIKIYGKIKSAIVKKEAEERISLINAITEESGLAQLDPVIQDLIKNAPTQEEFPQAAAVILFSHEDMVVNPDHTVEYTDHYLLKVLNERGKRYGEVTTGYDSTYGKVKIEIARTIKPDGTVISAGSKHMRDVSRYLNFPLYSNARVSIVSLPEVSVDSFIEYKVKTTNSKMIADDQFQAQYLLQSGDPIVDARFSVSVPKGRKLNREILNPEYNIINAELTPKIILTEDKDIYTWEFKNIPQIIPEPGMPPGIEITPVILLSTFNSWSEIYKWWWPLARDKIEVNASMREKIQELIKDKTSLLDKVKAIYNFCAKDIRYVAIEYGQAGHEPHRASEIFSNKYGDCKDQAILLVSMLKEIGVKAYPVLIGTRGSIKTMDHFPGTLFNHCIVAALMDDQIVFLDPTAETVSYGDLPDMDQDRRVFVIFEDKGELKSTPRFPPEHNTLVTKTVLKFADEQTIHADRTINTSGTFDQSQRYRFRYSMPILIKEGLKARIQEIIPGSKLIDYRIENLEDMDKEIILSYQFTGSDFLIKAGEAARIVPQLGGVDLSLASKDTRNYPIDFGLPAIQERTIEIQLPRQLIPEFLPSSIKKETPWFQYENSYTYDGGVIKYTEKSTQTADRLEVADYLQYKSILEALSKDVRQGIILKKM